MIWIRGIPIGTMWAPIQMVIDLPGGLMKSKIWKSSILYSRHQLDRKLLSISLSRLIMSHQNYLRLTREWAWLIIIHCTGRFPPSSRAEPLKKWRESIGLYCNVYSISNRTFSSPWLSEWDMSQSNSFSRTKSFLWPCKSGALPMTSPNSIDQVYLFT